jgi:hypothetical protein
MCITARGALSSPNRHTTTYSGEKRYRCTTARSGTRHSTDQKSSSLRGQGKTARFWQRYSTSYWLVMAEMSTTGSPSCGVHRRTNCSCGCTLEICPRLHGGHRKRSCRLISMKVVLWSICSSPERSVSISAFPAAL